MTELARACYNASQCPYPQQCLSLEPSRRYCADSWITRVYGRSLHLDLRAGARCDRCDAPLLLADFSLPDEVEGHVCHSACELATFTNASSAVPTAAAPYDRANCYTACAPLPVELYLGARYATSILYPESAEPSNHLVAARRRRDEAAVIAEDRRLAAVAASGLIIT